MQQITQIPPEVTVYDPGEVYVVRNHVILVGAGGVGARLAPILVKHLVAGDILSIADHDHVEGKNILRQHFISADVGRSKAEVVAERALQAAPVAGVIVAGYPLKVQDHASLAAMLPGHAESLVPYTVLEAPPGRYIRYRLVLITAIDSVAARRALAPLVGGLGEHVWVDCGNDMFTGQALVAGLRANLSVRPVGRTAEAYPTNFDGWAELAPNFLSQEDKVDSADRCDTRVDPQSVLANTWAATAAATLAMPFITGGPIISLGLAFSARSGATRMVGIQAVSDAGHIQPTGQLLN